MLTLDSFFADFRQTARSLWREKAFTATVLLTFGLCLGANVVIFTAVRTVVLNPLPFPAPDQLVTVYNSYPKLGIQHSSSSVPNFFERRDIESFTSVAAFRPGTAVMGESGSPERIASMQVTTDFFTVLDARPALGRFFFTEEGHHGKNDVVVLSNDYWCQHFNADPAAIGKTITIEGSVTTVIGVLPAGFRYLSTRASLWRPLAFSDRERDPGARHFNTLNVIARLRPGVTVEQAQAQITALNDRLSENDPSSAWASGAGFLTTVADLRDDHIAHVRPALMLLQAGVFLLLLIGIANVVNLLVVRASGRTKELAVRQVLGASRRNMALQFVGETTLLGFIGGLLALGFAALALIAIGRLGVDHLPRGADIALTVPIALAALGFSILVGLALAVPLVVFSTKSSLAPALMVESRSGTTTRSTHRFRHSLIVAQIALAFILISSAGLLGVSFRKVLSVDPGFRADNVITGWAGLSSRNYRDPAKRMEFANRWLDALRALPGVTAAGLGTSLPVMGEFGNLAMWIEGQPPAPGEAARAHHLAAATGDYFAAFGIPLHEGRFLNADDSQAAKPVCVIDTVFARRYWPDETALGHRISIGTADAGDKALTVVGVVGSVKQLGLNEAEGMGMLYYPLRKDTAPGRFVAVIRTQQDPASIAPAMRKTLLQIDPSLPLDDVNTMTARIDESLLLPRSLMLLGIVFAGIALVLAAIGVYGVLAYAVAQRQREIGVRLALGALPSHILRQFFRLGGTLFLAGAALGVSGAWIVARGMAGLLFGVSTGYFAVFAGTALVLAIVVFVASILPARRASAVSVMESLRSD